jgi:hydrogenase maturation protein HypF
MAPQEESRTPGDFRIAVIGIGNPYRGDDAVGVAFSRRIRPKVPKGVAVLEHDGDPASLMDAWRGADAVFLVDAVHSEREDDRVFRFAAHEGPVPAEFFRLSTHAMGVVEAIELARALGELPPRVMVYGIRGDRFDHTEDLSPEVDGACKTVVLSVLDEIRDIVADRRTAGSISSPAPAPLDFPSWPRVAATPGDSRSLQATAAGSMDPRCVGLSRMRVVVRGAVQGVGFRPFVYRLADELQLTGWVNNTGDGVFVEVEGPRNRLEEFLLRIPRDKPPVSTIHSLQHAILDPAGYERFEIVESEKPREGADITTPILPDIATCPDCLREMFDPDDRRHRYPFINCTNCGPRFSIVEGLPYDRPATTMKAFEMCPRCAAEYEDPSDRRFHAQPNACPACGPALEWRDGEDRTLASGDDALLAAAEAIRRGDIAAVKGLGGFHLVVDARSDAAVRRLRERKRRDEKPFAVMVPGVEYARSLCAVTDVEAWLLQSPEAPIVLLRRGGSGEVSGLVAPGNPYLGVMVPYTPLHHLLMAELGFPVVATSANLAEEPICTDERDALGRLAGIADAFLVHNRPIARHVDDSVVRVVGGRMLVTRRARGYAPLPVPTPAALGGVDSPSALAVGGHLKNTVAIARGGQVFVSQHIGDMSTATAFDAFQRIVADFGRLYRFEPERIACDLHPDYVTTKYAARSGGPPVVEVQHHFAHVAACMMENELDAPVLGVSWDGAGYGTDGTVWGGEFLRVAGGRFDRVAHLKTFRLPGGDAAAREPRRSAAGVLFELFGNESRERLAQVQAFTGRERSVILGMMQRSVNSPVTSSAGRLFDAVASIAGVRHRNHFEGQAAMELEFATDGVPADGGYTIDLIHSRGGCMVVDWRAMVRAIIADVENGVATGLISTRFHNAMAEAVVGVARAANEERVLLTGGCFQNKYLTERAVARLEAAGFKPYWHQRIPPNDGGIALGQLAAAAMQRRGA